jgi:hypothetical protein
MVFVAGRAGAWATDWARTFLRWASGLEFAGDEACNGDFRGRRFVRWVTDCGTWADGDIGAGGSVAVGVCGGGEKEMTIDSLKDASRRWSGVECFLLADTAVALRGNRPCIFVESAVVGWECFCNLEVLWCDTNNSLASVDRSSEP